MNKKAALKKQAGRRANAKWIGARPGIKAKAKGRKKSKAAMAAAVAPKAKAKIQAGAGAGAGATAFQISTGSLTARMDKLQAESGELNRQLPAIERAREAEKVGSDKRHRLNKDRFRIIQRIRLIGEELDRLARAN